MLKFNQSIEMKTAALECLKLLLIFEKISSCGIHLSIQAGFFLFFINLTCIKSDTSVMRSKPVMPLAGGQVGL
jgi:hypothetical protein